jgi:hypothetical protein
MKFKIYLNNLGLFRQSTDNLDKKDHINLTKTMETIKIAMLNQIK